VSAVGLIRNLGIVAHINAGKTTLSERMLFLAGRVRFMGEVDDGTAAMDFLPEEQRRGISIRSACTTLRWRGHVVNLVDTPGHIDFGAEVERALRVLDGAVLVLDGVRGVESQSEAVWRQAKAHRVPVLAFVNKLDRPVADWTRVVQAIRERLHARVLPAVVPIVGPDGLTGLVDVVTGTVTRFADGGTPALDPVRARAELVEAAADFDATILDDFVLERPVDDRRLRGALRTGVVSGHLVLAFAGSALHNRGVAELLDGVCAYLPSPLDMPDVRGLQGGVRAPRADVPTCALVFGSSADEGVERSVLRLYSGEIVPGTVLRATGVEAPVTVREIFRLHADDYESIQRAGPGDIVAVGGDLTGIRVGATLFSPTEPIELAPTRFATAVLGAAVEPRQVEDRPVVEAAVRRLVRTDPALEVRVDPARDVMVLSGMGELHLEVAGERLRAAVGDRFRLGRPEVAFRETVAKAGTGIGEWRVPELSARVVVGLQVAPAPGQGPARVHAADSLSDPVVATALADALATGLATNLRAGWPAHDLTLEITRLERDGPPDADLLPFLLEAAGVALRRALAEAEPILLQPLVRLEVSCPHDALSAVLGDLRGKEVTIEAVDMDGTAGRIRGVAPLRRMLGYSTRLRSLTRGLGSFGLEPAGHAPMPEAEA